MSLIEINIPEDDGWEDILASRLLLLILGAMLMRVGLRLWHAAFQEGGLVAGILTTLCFALGVQLLVFAIAGIDLEAHGRTIAYIVIGELTLMTIALSWSAGIFGGKLGSDVIAFTSYAVELVSSGQNPFAHSMAGAADLPGHPDEWTLRTDGSRVVSWSYPGGSLWIYGLQFITVGRTPIGIRLTSIIGVAAVAVLLVKALPAIYAPAAPLSLTISQNEWLAAAGGLNDMWWLLPTAGALILWAGDRRMLAAVALGAACAVKQQPWPIAGFLAIWVWHESNDLSAFAKTGGRYAAAGLGSFALLNLPWLLSDPSAWVNAILVPIAGSQEAPLVSTGVGLAALNSAAGVIPRRTFELAIPISLLGAAAAYYVWFDKLRWMAWLSPPIVLFFAPRSLPSYFHWFVPIAVLALFAHHGELPIQQREVGA